VEIGAGTCGVRPAVAAVGAAVGVVLGVLAERAAHLAAAFWVPDLAVGLAFLCGGAVAWARRPSSATGILMTAAGITWFLPNFAGAEQHWLAWMAVPLLFLYRGPLVHALVTFPTGRAGSWPRRVVILAGYLAAAATPLWRSDRVAVVLAGALLGFGYLDQRHARGRIRLARRIGLVATAAVTLAVAGGAVARLVVPGDRALEPTRWITELALCVAAGWLTGTLLGAPWTGFAVIDLVVEVETAPSDRLRAALARALGDPNIAVGYRSGAGWVDVQGRPFAFPEEQAGRAVTVVRNGQHPVAALVHDPAILDDPALVDAVNGAARLSAANALLQAEVRAQVEELAASRRRLLEVADDERRLLEERLHEGAQRRLRTLSPMLSGAAASARDAETRSHLAAAEAELRDSQDDVVRLARGLHPRELTDLGLAGALDALAGRTPLPVSVSVQADEVPPALAASAYYVCLEALTNVVKHARAGRVRLAVTADGADLRVEVVDDGVGGAEVRAGSGLRGLADRVEALGGSLSVDSPGGEGTRLAARVPLLPRPDRPVSRSG